MSNFPPSLDANARFINDDFAELHDGEIEYEGDLAHHPAVLDAFRFQAQLDHLVVTDTASFADVVNACLENINDRAIDLHEQLVTIHAPAAHIIRSIAHADLEDGETSVGGTPYDVFSQDTANDTETQPALSPLEQADCLTGPFGGFAFLFEELPGSESDEETVYRVNLYARVRADYAETPLIVASIFHAARLSHASITADHDILADDLDFAANQLEAYRDTPIYDKLQAAESAIHNSSFAHGHLQKIDEVCRELFAEEGMVDQFSIQDSLIDLMKLAHSPDEVIDFKTAAIVQLEHVDEVGKMSYFTPPGHAQTSVVKITSNLLDYAFLPRTIVNQYGEYELCDDTLGLYLAIDLANGQVGYIPAEYLKHIA